MPGWLAIKGFAAAALIPNRVFSKVIALALQVSSAALALFKFGQEQATAQGLLLVDTKYEFGVDADGQILLIDEMHTPDSSRWVRTGNMILPCASFLHRSCDCCRSS